MDWHEEYKRRYAQLKHEGESFYPSSIFKDTVMAFLILGALCAFAYFFGAELEDLADPTDTTYNPRPEWYFLFLFEALKFFPGNLEPLAVVGLPGIAGLVLILWPILDRRPHRHPLDRPVASLLALGSLVGIMLLTYRGLTAPFTNPIVKKDPIVAEGHRLYQDLKCSYCHSIGGKGGLIGPDLGRVSSRGEEWLTKHLRDPRSVFPGSQMPKLDLLDEEIRALVAYIVSLGGGGPYTEEAPKIFTNNCAACHRIGKEGGQMGPDLSLIGTARDKNFIKKYIEDPTLTNKAATMPGFKDRLTDVQVEDLARYLAAQRGT